MLVCSIICIIKEGDDWKMKKGCNLKMKETIYRLRTSAKMSQEDFAGIFNVSRQLVQKWENGTAIPELSKLIEISKHFDISLDSLVLSVDDCSVRKQINTQTHFLSNFCYLFANIASFCSLLCFCFIKRFP